MNKVAKNAVWNLIGSFTYFFSQWLMTVLVLRLSGSYEEAGVFGLAVSVCNIFLMISLFSVRTYQVTDTDEGFSKGQYVTLRFITCSASLLILAVYLLFSGYSPYTFGSVMCFMLIKTAEALADVFHGMLQKDWRLDLACRSLVIRGLAGLAVFSAVEYLLKNLVVSLLAAALVSLLCALLLDLVPCFSMYGIRLCFKDGGIWRLCAYCVPLFFHNILAVLIANIPRITVERLLGEEMLGYYSSAATPAIIVQLAASNLFFPCVPLLSEQYKKGDRAIFKTILKVQLIIAVVGACAVVGFAWLGDCFLKLVFGEELLKYGYLLVPAAIVSILTAMSWFVAALFTVINKNTVLVIVEFAVTAATFAASSAVINGCGLQGVNWILIGAYGLFIFVGYLFTLINISRHCGKPQPNG